MLSKEIHQRWLEHQILANEERAQRLCGRIPRARAKTTAILRGSSESPETSSKPQFEAVSGSHAVV